MKSTQRILSCFLFLALTATCLQAEIVAIDFQKVFESYTDLINEDQKLREEVAVFQAEQQEKVQALQAQQQKFNELRNQAAQPDMEEADRKQLVKEATAQLEALNKEEQALRQERTQFQKDLEAKGLRLRRGIVEEVNEKVVEIAEEQGWEMVLDSSAKSPNGLPMLAYTVAGKDKTAYVIRELNMATETATEVSE